MSVLIKGYEKPRRCVECIGCFAKMCSLKSNERCPLDGTPEWCPMEETDAIERESGAWLPFEFGDDTWHKCSVCGCAEKYIYYATRSNGTIVKSVSIRNICPMCGADMR